MSSACDMLCVSLTREAKRWRRLFGGVEGGVEGGETGNCGCKPARKGSVGRSLASAHLCSCTWSPRAAAANLFAAGVLPGWRLFGESTRSLCPVERDRSSKYCAASFRGLTVVDDVEVIAVDAGLDSTLCAE